jgi:ribosomal protein S14
MDKLIRKDKKNRMYLYKYEIKRFILKNIIRNNNFSLVVKCKAHLMLLQMPKEGTTTTFSNRCIFTGRRKRINKFYSFSRIMFLKLVRFGYLSGLKKSSW